MSLGRNRIIVGALLITVGFLGLVVYLPSFTIWGYSMWLMGPMRGRWNYGELKELIGTVEKIEWMEIELEVDGEEIGVHGPSWFWQGIGIEMGDVVSARGVFVSMMGHGEGWHEGFISFELTVNGETYGNAKEGIPVWMQG